MFGPGPPRDSRRMGGASVSCHRALWGSEGVLPNFWPWLPNSVAGAKEYTWVYNEMSKGNLFLGLALLVPHHQNAGWGFNHYYDVSVTGSVSRMFASLADLIPKPDLIATNFFNTFEQTDADIPNWGNSLNWIYTPDGDPAAAAKLPVLPILSPPPMDKIKNHAKLLAEAIPPLSGAAGFFASAAILKVRPSGRCFDLNSAPFKDVSLWPTTRPNKSDDQQIHQRWLHCDYLDAAYLLTHSLYDRIAELTN